MSAQIQTYAMVDATQTVVNVCLWDGVTEFAPAGVTLVQSDTAKVGDTYDGTNFTTPPPP
jgi:hypothetical protein